MISNRDTIMCLDDEVLVALDLCETLKENGFTDVHPVHTVSQANKLLDDVSVALGVLDVNLGQGETSFDIARRLSDNGSKIVFVTGYDRLDLPEEFHSAPVLRKPLDLSHLLGLIRAVS